MEIRRNVIERPAERLEALVDAFRHAKRLLVVAALITETVDTTTAQRFADGVLTWFNTFQKYFEQQELQQYIEDALEVSAVPVALEGGDGSDLAWLEVARRFGIGMPSKPLWSVLLEQHKELLEVFSQTLGF